MFSKITWSEYWLFIAATTTLYYAVIAVGYFRNELLAVFRGRRNITPHPGRLHAEAFANTAGQPPAYEEPADNEASETDEEDSTDDNNETSSEETYDESAYDDEPEEADEESLQQLEALSDAVNRALEAHGGVTNKEEVIVTLAATIKKYADIERIEPFTESIEWHLQRQAQLLCNVVLSASDIRCIWTIVQDNA